MKNVYDANIKEIYRMDRERWAFGKYATGDLFVGNLMNLAHADWYKDTKENREKAEQYWKFSSFSKEVKL